jgi:hypothetical protein
LADNSKKDTANIQFQKLQRAEDGKKAMSEYEAAGAAARANMERLKALRLAREANAPKDGGSTAATPKKKPAAKGGKGTAKAKKTKGAPLSEWLKGREEDGRD